ncbi:MAG TPA: 8-oxo-dGTP diphosphatase [archaeon]|nr:8-oxo-dGTP diphosphatase [archaeon]
MRVLKDGVLNPFDAIKKKKGIGAGFWNGPGGKVENGEDIKDAAKREVYEEVCVVPEAPVKIGQLKFHYQAGEWDIHIFVADDFDGIERETEEAAPKWFRIDNVPYGEMWPDDRIWMPLMFQGKKFIGSVHFDESNNMLSHDIKEVEVI